MRKDQTVNGYEIITEPTNAGAGQCTWARGRKGGEDFFVKEFYAPKYPPADSRRKESIKARQRAACEQFERRHRAVMDAVDPSAPGGGNLVTATDFFRADTTYYKVTEWVAAQVVGSLHEMTRHQAAVAIKTLANSVILLHRAGIVHGDLKPRNVLLQHMGRSDLYIAKVIDFDDSYPIGEPPPPGLIVGDDEYAAPEWLGYIKEDPSIEQSALGQATDVFSLALIVHQWLAGQSPGYDRSRYGSAAAAVRAGESLALHPQLHPQMYGCLRLMLDIDPASRPSARALLAVLATETAALTAEPLPDLLAAGATTRVKINLGPRSMPDPPVTEPPKAAPAPPPGPRPGSRVRFNFPTGED